MELRRQHSRAKLTHDDIVKIVGNKYGRLIVLNFKEKRVELNYPFRITYWYECRCDCGNTHVVRRDRLLKGFTRSCGCISIINNEA